MTDPRPRVLLDRLLGPVGPELTCEECFAQLDRYVELEVTDPGSADAAVPGMRAHFAGCPACGEDHDSLLALINANRESSGPVSGPSVA